MGRETVIDPRKWQVYLPISALVLLAPLLMWFIRQDSLSQRSYFDSRHSELIHRMDLLHANMNNRDAALATWVESFRMHHPELKVPIYKPQ